jgi:uncharacterized membrane protein YraQ (UPF0718 family)
MAQLLHIFVAAWDTLVAMAPYLLLGFLAAGILSVLVSAERVERLLGKPSFGSIVKAALVGIPLPLCSCSVIPVTVSLRKHGASKGAATAFLLSTPQTGVDSIIVTWSLLGPVFAIFRPVVALITGLIGGVSVELMGNKNGGPADSIAPCTDECCTGSTRSALYRIFHYGFVTLLRDLARPLVVGVIIAGVIAALVPDDYFAGAMGGGLPQMLVMMAVGVPLYVCSTASVPIAAALLAKGVSPGAALVFLITGAATNAAGIATVWSVLGQRTALIYLATVIVTALLGGIALNALIGTTGIYGLHSGTHGEMLPSYVSIGSALLLVALIVPSFVRPLIRRQRTACGHSRT